MEYLNFEISLEERAGGDFLVLLLDSPVGQAREVTHFPMAQDELTERLGKLRETLTRSRGGRDIVVDVEELTESTTFTMV